jgi:hypothetical protein
MFIETINASSSLRTKRLEVNKPIWALLLVRRSSESFVDSLAAAPERLTVELNSKQGKQITLMHNLEIGVAAHYGQYGEGIISEDFIPLAHPEHDGQRSWRVRILVPLTQGKGIVLADNENLYVTLSQMRQEGVYDVYGLEYPETGTNMLEYSILSMSAGVRSKVFNVDNAEAIVLRRGSYLNRVTVTYKNGYIANYSEAELTAINSDNNDIEGVIRSIGDTGTSGTFVPVIVTCGQSNYATLVVRDAVSVEVITNGTAADFYQVSLLSRLLS